MQDYIIKNVHGKAVIFDKQDEDIFNKYTWFLCKKENNTFYVVTDIYLGNNKSKRKYFHQFILGTKKGFLIDHINRNPLDNRRSNLRFATRSLNAFNSKIRNDNKSGYRNISFDKSRNKWVARKQIGDKYKFLGRFETKNDAIKHLESI